jgi:hypothetical protein
MSCAVIAKALFPDDDTIGTTHRAFEQDGIEALGRFAYEGRS